MAQVDVMWAWRRRWSMVTDRNANQEYYRSRGGKNGGNLSAARQRLATWHVWTELTRLQCGTTLLQRERV
jgi:hypothetical protein